LCGASREGSGFRKLKVLSQYRGRIADQLSGGETVAGKGRERARGSRTAGPSEEMVQDALKKGSSRAGLQGRGGYTRGRIR